MRTSPATYHVIKFGGTSVANLERLEAVADRIVAQYAQNTVVVVSAMAGMTDNLMHDMQKLCPAYATAAHDMVLSSGEPITCGLLSLALAKRGLKAKPFLGWQIPIMTDSSFQQSRIKRIGLENICEALDKSFIPVVAGFQGVDSNSCITTLGRGGSDTTAVALAAALRANCSIYTDVNGVYTADPRIVSKAYRIPNLSIGEMLEMSSLGAKVLQARSVELAMKYSVDLHVHSSFIEGKGTVVHNQHSPLEGPVVRAITHHSHITWIKAESSAAKVIEKTSAENLTLNMVQVLSSTSSQFWVHTTDLAKFKRLAHDITCDICLDMGQVSVVGIGLQSNPHILHTALHELEHCNIQVHACSATEMAINFLVEEINVPKAAALLHAVFLENDVKQAA